MTGYIIAICIIIPLFLLLSFSLYYISEKPSSKLILCESHALITGGSSGIGFECAKQLIEKGVSITIIARNKIKLNNAVNELQNHAKSTWLSNKSRNSKTQFRQQKIIGLSADCSNESEISSVIDESISIHGSIEISILSAGITEPGLFIDQSKSSEIIKKLINTNILGTYYTCKSLIPYMQNKSLNFNNDNNDDYNNNNSSTNRLLIVSSMAGLSGVAGYSSYSITKFALRGLAESLHMEVANVNTKYKNQIFVSLVCPPDVDTESYAQEQLIKPEECKLISEGTGLFKPDKIASDIISGGIESYRFLICSGFDGRILECLCRGTAPLHSITSAYFDLFIMGFVRVISAFYRWNYNMIVHKCHTKKYESQQSNTNTKLNKSNSIAQSDEKTDFVVSPRKKSSARSRSRSNKQRSD